MCITKNTSSFLFAISAVFLLFILCIGPTKPPFTEAAKFTDKQIKTQGTPVVDSSFLLYVSAEGTAPLLYQWYKNSVEISNARDDTLKFDLISISDSGNYQCFVWNDDGSDTSLIYSLKVLTLPLITTPNKRIQTSSSIPKIDSLFYMYITATGSDTLHYYWYLNSILQGIDNDTFLVTALSHSDTGIYQCIVSNNGGSDTSLTYNLSFSGNHPPYWEKDTMVDAVKEMITYKMVLSDSCTDPDTGDIVTFTLGAGIPAGDSIADDSIYIYSPTFDDAGVYHINLWAKDGIDSSLAVLKLTVLDSNRAPEFKDSLPLDLYRLEEGQQLIIKFEAEDPDGDTAIVFLDTANTTLPRKETIVFNDSQLVWQSTNTDSGAFSVVLGATDNIDTKYFNITVTVNDVNLPPEISIAGYQNGDNVQITEGVELAFTVSVDDPDTGQAPVLTSPINIPTGAVFDTASGGFSYTPDFSVSNKISNTTFSNVTFYATDNMAARAIDSFVIHITVLDSNRVPVCNDTSLTVNEETTTPVNIFATDPDGDALTWEISQHPVTGTVDTANGIIGSDPEFEYTIKNLLATCKDSIQVKVEDGVSQYVMTVTITINADNDPPIIDQAPPVNAVEDITNPYSINIAGHDPESTAVRWYIHTLPKKGNLDKLEGDISAGIEMLYTLKADSCGKDTLTFYLLDAHNISSDTQAIQITIDSLNDAPIINSQSGPLSFDEDNNLELLLSHLNVVDSDNELSGITLIVIDDLNYSIVSETTIKPDLNYNGPLTVKVQVSDGEAASSVFDMSVTVNPINDKPEISITSYTTDTTFGSAAFIVASFSDVENEIDSISFIIDSRTDTSAVATGLTSFQRNWTATFDAYVIGPHYVVAIISDKNGAKGTTDTKIINIIGTGTSDTLSLSALGLLEPSPQITVSDNRVVNFVEPYWTSDTLGPEIGNLSKLEGFELVTAGLSFITPEIGRLICLKSFNLSNNNIEGLPDEICNLINLESIDISSNSLSILPTEFGNLVNLTNLKIHNNNITDLPEEIINLTKIAIDDLNLYGNKLPTNAIPPKPWEQWATERDPDWRTTQQSK